MTHANARFLPGGEGAVSHPGEGLEVRAGVLRVRRRRSWQQQVRL